MLDFSGSTTVSFFSFLIRVNRFIDDFIMFVVQAKGPKGQRLVIKTQAEDPHHLNEVTDPVFSPNCSVRGIKVSFLIMIIMFGS